MIRLNTSLARFFALSMAIHAIAFAYVILVQTINLPPKPRHDPIAVSLLPPREEEAIVAAPVPRTAGSRISKSPAIVGRKDSAAFLKNPTRAQQKAALTPQKAGELGENPGVERNQAATIARANEQVATASWTQRETIPEQTVLADRQLPSVKELLPPITYSSGARSSTPVSLNTKDRMYVSYFTRIKQAIEQNWEYPALALRYGLQGRLSLEFTVGANGQLEQLRIIRSSGSQLLDEEATRAIKAAAPFPPIPASIKANPLSISASMEYYDNRLNYHFSR